MRLSIRPNDPGYATYVHVTNCGKRALVKFNGEPQYQVITADTDAGMLVRLTSPVQYDKDRAAFADEVCHGRVEVEIYDPVTI